MQKQYDLIIVGSGPAGLTAAIYAQRAKLNTLVIEETGVSGGQVLTTYEVDNYPGLPGISGYELGTKMREHADKLGAGFIDGCVSGIKDEGKTKIVETSADSYETKAVIIATGASHAKLGVAGEEELTGMGVSYCATCDGAFFKNKTVAVVGGGDVAVEDAIFLARFCHKVYVIHRRDELRAAQILREALLRLPNVEMIWDSKVINIEGEEQVQAIRIQNVKTEAVTQLELQGVFVAVGIHPNTEAFLPLLKANDKGYIVADEMGITNVPGIFVAGDARMKSLRQIVTAVADGANAVTSVQEYYIHR
ncbi:MAG: thioredoxin-disulfide reductase [Lachnospiraceae bacterium]